MSTYLEEVIAEKKFRGNVVIQIGGDGLLTEAGEQLLTEDGEDLLTEGFLFSIREPDSGLTIPAKFKNSVTSLLLNPTTIDVRKVTTTISSFSFRLLDKDGIISQLVLGDAANLIGREVRIWLGRSGTGMDFSNYFELPRTTVTKCEHADNTYNFSCSEPTERMGRPIYDFESALGVDILAGTTTWTMRDDITNFPATGFLKVDSEFVSYSGKDLVNNRFTGVIRGELNSVPAAHEANSNVVLVETVTDNPLNILLKILVSGGGGGTYDVLQDGLGLSESLIDVAEIEALRDELFLGHQFTLSLYSIDSALKYIEDQILAPNNLRLITSRNSKVSVAILNKARFVEEDDVISEDNITKFPKWAIDGIKVTNVIEVQWDFSEGTNMYQKKTTFEDADSIAIYGRSTTLKYAFKGLKTSLDGEELVNDFGSRLLARLAFPTPEISVNTHLDKSLQNVGDKSYLVSSKIPAADGTLNFASNLEIISRAINQTNGDVQFKLAFTSFTNFRSGFIAPSDMIISFPAQDRVQIEFGRGAQYRVGWYMRLWDNVNNVYLADAPNKIIFVGQGGGGILLEDGGGLLMEDGEGFLTEDTDTDLIVFENAWTTPLSTNYRIRFADYDNAIESQKRYSFISDDELNFASDDKPPYRITY